MKTSRPTRGLRATDGNKLTGITAYLDFEALGIIIAKPLIAFVGIGDLLSSLPHFGSSILQEGTDLREDEEEVVQRE